MFYYFTKVFQIYNLDKAEYYKCPNCGFCASKTHFDMGTQEWEKLNISFHEDNNVREDNPYNRNQRYFNQAMMLYLMTKHEIISSSDWLDWGSGLGSLSIQLEKHFNLTLFNYDQYITPLLNVKTEEEITKKSFDLVVNTAVFEHVRERSTLNEIESYVNDSGCLGVHTLVREEIPEDSEWMYLLPVHCAFFTNKSMSILMNVWGYTCSVYNEHSKLWVMFKSPSAIVETKVRKLNNILGFDYLHFKRGFMDYWH